ncbi:hypothetical protein HW555_009572 [Spodoptera exigua]|uniref:serine C-palmitoyltransferase n=1 Tax=Spodoptera exigua TaxID=7107 RepID=A0A835GAD0_SPOEX|nr:hypothetical protein HW555_009572 [Spodoptera exigua]
MDIFGDRMATTIAGSGNYRDLSKPDKQGFNELKENLQNGKTTNGYVKSNDFRNGDTKFSLSGGGIPKMDWSKYDTFPGSFEKCTLLTAVLTHFGLYILMFLGFVNQLLFTPKVATEKNREIMCWLAQVHGHGAALHQPGLVQLPRAAIVVGMGFGTNTLGLPGLLGPGSLALSDEKNHASLIMGLRLARATVRVFRHNDVRHLEQLARAAIAERKWTKIVIAHSIGALGSRGRGVCDHAGVAPRDVDVLMGTFTKSVGASGGYIAGSAKLINWIRQYGHMHTYAHAMSPPVAQQIVAAMRLLDEPAGRARLLALRDNTHYFRDELRRLGVVTLGHPDSPVVPVLVYTFSKMAATVERLTDSGVATVGVGFPATPLNKARIRFCLSASHSREQLQRCVEAVARAVRELGLDYSRQRR